MPASSIFSTRRLVDLLVGLDQHLTGERVDDIFQGHPAQDALPDGLDDLPAFHQRGDENPVDGPAIVLR